MLKKHSVVTLINLMHHWCITSLDIVVLFVQAT